MVQCITTANVTQAFRFTIHRTLIMRVALEALCSKCILLGFTPYTYMFMTNVRLVARSADFSMWPRHRSWILYPFHQNWDATNTSFLMADDRSVANAANDLLAQQVDPAVDVPYRSFVSCRVVCVYYSVCTGGPAMKSTDPTL
jgi:hypothetical protein